MDSVIFIWCDIQWNKSCSDLTFCHYVLNDTLFWFVHYEAEFSMGVCQELSQE